MWQWVLMASSGTGVQGMTQAGIERKATCRALYAKLLYLAESEEILPSLDALARKELVQDVFGAVKEDTDQLRIVTLYEVDLDDAFALQSSPGSEGFSDEPGTPTAGDGEEVAGEVGDPGFST